MDTLSYLMGLKIGKKSEGGGGSDAEKYYLYGTNGDYITMPFKPKNTLKITLDIYADQDANMPNNLSAIIRYGGQTTWVFSRRQKAVGMYRGNWNTCDLWDVGKQQTQIVIDRANRVLSATGNIGTVINNDSANNWPESNDYYILELGEWCGHNRVKVEEGGAVIYDLIATVDTAGKPCMKDTLTGTYYYANGDSAILKTLA